MLSLYIARENLAESDHRPCEYIICGYKSYIYYLLLYVIYSQGLCPQSFCEQANVYLQVRSCKRHPTGWDHRSKLGECYSSVLSDPRFPGGKASLLVFQNIILN